MNSIAAVCDRTVLVSEDPEILAAVRMPDTELAIWQRRCPTCLSNAHSAPTAEIDRSFTLAGLDEALDAALAEAGYGAAGEPLSAELSALARRFAAIMTCDTLRIRVHWVEDDACRKFHRDFVSVRLLLTLSGPGTQWIDGREGADAPIHALEAGDVALVKGRRWSPEGQIQHRSPAIRGTGLRRLVVAMDPVEADAA